MEKETSGYLFGSYAGRVRLNRDSKFPSQQEFRHDPDRWIEEKRKNAAAYEYLCHIDEAKQWLEMCTGEELPPAVELGPYLQNGVVLAKLTQKFEPQLCKKVFENEKLQFRHSENINAFINFMKLTKLPSAFIFELTDLYDLKNFPKVVYTIHALSHLLVKLGRGPKIQNLLGKAVFSDSEIEIMQARIEESGVRLPAFSSVTQTLERELNPNHIEQQAVKCQRAIRGMLERKRTRILHFEQNAAKVEIIQEQIRQMLLAKQQKQKMLYLQQKTKEISVLQAHVRGLLGRQKVKEMKLYEQKLQNEELTVPEMSKFMHLFAYKKKKDDTIDLEIERLQAEVMRLVQENQELETDLAEKDMKIELLVKNRITIDDYLKSSKKPIQKQSSTILFHTRPSSKQDRSRLECYQTILYLVQTMPKYLCSLVDYLKDQNKELCSRVLSVAMKSLFLEAKNVREEYFLLKLMEHSIEMEVLTLESVDCLLKTRQSLIGVLMKSYILLPREQAFLKLCLSEGIEACCLETDHLETDVVNLHKLIIKEEESITGVKSKKKYDVQREDVLEDQIVMRRLQQHYEKLYKLVKIFMDHIMKSLKLMPFGIRHITKTLFSSLLKNFKAHPEDIWRSTSHVLFTKYLNPAIVAPEEHQIVEKLHSISRKNLIEVSKILSSICSTQKNSFSRLMTANLEPDWVDGLRREYFTFLQELVNIEDLESNLHFDEYMDATKKQKPTILISPTNILFLHEVLDKYKMEIIKPEQIALPDSNEQEEPMLSLLKRIQVPEYDRENVEPELTITLAIKQKLVMPEQYELKKLFALTKLEIVRIIRVHGNCNTIKQMLDCKSTQRDEDVYSQYELNASRNMDIITLAQSKAFVRESLKTLEQHGIITSYDGYADVMKSITRDLRKKHHKAAQSKITLRNLQETLKVLQEKQTFLKSQEHSFNEYIEACKLRLNTPEKKVSKFMAPFSKQARHLLQMEKKTGRAPVFGSYKFPVKQLLDQKILIAINVEGVAEKLIERSKLTITSFQSGVFDIMASIPMRKDSESITLEDLLALEYEAREQISLFDGCVVADVKNLVLLLNKKFFS